MRSVSVAALVIAAGSIFGQQTAAPEIAVVSIKPSDPDITAMNNRFPPGRFTLIGYSLMSLIEQTYGLREYQILDAPGWLRSERWTLEGELTATVRLIGNFQLLKPVLAERFGLSFRRETRMLPVFSLVVAKGGPKLKAPQDDKPQSTRYGDMIVGTKYDIRWLAADLSGNLNIPVVDKTGLQGIYDIDLRWTPDPARQDFGDVHAPTDPPPYDPNRPEIFTALKEQLGLELKAEKGPVEVIVIDHAQRPSAN